MPDISPSLPPKIPSSSENEPSGHSWDLPVMERIKSGNDPHAGHRAPSLAGRLITRLLLSPFRYLFSKIGSFLPHPFARETRSSHARDTDMFEKARNELSSAPQTKTDLSSGEDVKEPARVVIMQVTPKTEAATNEVLEACREDVKASEKLVEEYFESMNKALDRIPPDERQKHISAFEKARANFLSAVELFNRDHLKTKVAGLNMLVNSVILAEEGVKEALDNISARGIREGKLTLPAIDKMANPEDDNTRPAQ